MICEAVITGLPDQAKDKYVMTSQPARGTTENSSFIRAPREANYRAFTDPLALAVWLAPDGMTGEVNSFDGKVGGGYQMSLYYPSSAAAQGKTSAREDRFTARFVELTPPTKIVEAVTFDS